MYQVHYAKAGMYWHGPNLTQESSALNAMEFLLRK